MKNVPKSVFFTCALLNAVRGLRPMYQFNVLLWDSVKCLQLSLCSSSSLLISDEDFGDPFTVMWLLCLVVSNSEIQTEPNITQQTMTTGVVYNEIMATMQINNIWPVHGRYSFRDTLRSSCLSKSNPRILSMVKTGRASTCLIWQLTVDIAIVSTNYLLEAVRSGYDF